MRIIFAGTPSFAAAHLSSLIDASDEDNFDIVAVYTQPDRRAGRGKKLLPSPVKQLALDNEIAVEQPLSLKPDQQADALAAYNADIMVVVAYGLILPERILNIPRLGCINVHASLLPRWRGAAPIERAIEAGDEETGITIMQMDVGLDTGDMLLSERCHIAADETGDSLREKLIELGRPLLRNALLQLDRGDSHPIEQDDTLANYAHKLLKDEAQINWALTANALERKIRAFDSAMPCYFTFDDQRVKVIQAHAIDPASNSLSSNTPSANTPGTVANVDKHGIDVLCEVGALRLKKLQLAGGKALNIADILNGKPDLFKSGMMLNLPNE